jgi:nucleotide-binding universal stress UspA family protein
MSWKRILVFIESQHECSPAIETAVSVARRQNASVTGLYCIREVAIGKILLGPDQKLVRDRPLIENAENAFRESCATAGVDCEWDVAEGDAKDVINLAGRCHDLIVIQKSDIEENNLATDIADDCVASSGVPTLIVPRSRRNREIGKRIIVGWDHGREASIALHAALPLIEKAEQVVVLLGLKPDAVDSLTRAPRHEILEYLRLYNKNVDGLPFEPTSANQGASLLEAAHQASADLLVMGAHGHSKVREFFRGGATQSVLADLDIPVLMSH